MGRASGTYAFRMDGISETELELGVTYAGTLSGSGHAQLFKVDVPEGNPLLVEFDDSTDSDRTEIYLDFGTPPTRREFDHNTRLVTADHRLPVSFAAPGTWYVLVYGRVVQSPTDFTLRVISTPVLLTGVTPDTYNTDLIAGLTLTGAGFFPGAHVELVASDGTTFSRSRLAWMLPTESVR